MTDSRAIYGGDAREKNPTIESYNSALKQVSDIDALNINQNLLLDKLFYDSRTSDEYPQQQTSNIVTFVGQNQNWTRMKENILEVTCQLNFTFSLNVSGTSPGPDYVLFPNPYSGLTTSYTTAGLSRSADYNYGYWYQPEFAFLTPVRRFEVKMGTNNQVMGRYRMNYLDGILHHAKDRRFIIEEIDYMCNIGVPMSRGCYNLNNISLYSQPVQGTQSDQDQFCRKFSQKVLELYSIAYLNAAIALPDGADYTNINANLTSLLTGSRTLSTVFKLAIPINFLNGALDTNAYFPPGLPFRYELEFSNDPTLCMTNYFDPASVSSNTVRAGFAQTISINYLNSGQYGGFLIHRREHTLRQEAQEKINSAWLHKPLCFQYETYEFYDFPTLNGVNTFYSQIISNSQQRPVQLFLVVLQKSQPLLSTTMSSNSTKINTNTLSFENAISTGFRFTEVKVFISGRQSYYLRTPYAINGQSDLLTGSDGRIKDATNTLECIINCHTYQEGDESNLARSKMWGLVEGSFLSISINPGDIARKQFISGDQDANTIKLEFNATDTFGNPIDSHYTIRVYKKFPEMFTIDAEQRITTVAWPGLVTPSGGYAVATTHNLN